jgi:hypothetical protein
MNRMTAADLLRMESVTIPGTWAAQVMGMDPTRLIGYAREAPEKISFPYQLSGNRMHIPRVPFLRWLGFTDEEIKNAASGS